MSACSSTAEPSRATSNEAGANDEDAEAVGDAGVAFQDASGDVFVPVQHPAFPVIPNQGGPIVASPELVTITWAGDSLADGLEAFDAWLLPSTFWKTLMAEWGVGPGKQVAHYRVPSAAPSTMTQDEIEQLVATLFAEGKVPPPTSSRIYSVYPPAGTRVVGNAGEGCVDFQAFHYSFDAKASPDAGALTRAIYAVTPRCAVQGHKPLDYTTWGMSHEIMEAASDPLADQPAYRIDVQTPATPELGENADLCTGQPTMIDGHMVTRNWSNVAAKQGKAPCVPTPAGMPDVGAFPDQPVIKLAAGKTATVQVHVWSSAPTAPLHLLAYPADPMLTASLSDDRGTNGDVLTMTITAKKGFVSQLGTNLVMIYVAVDDYNTRTSLIVQ